MSRETKAAVLFELGQPVRVIDLSIPALKHGQVLVDVAFSGICHTQLMEVRGRRGEDHFLPHTIGHEGSGVVLAVGAGVTKVQSGDRVVLSWIKGSGSDVGSTVYESPEGIINSGAISTLMSHSVTCENRVTPISNEMPLREAALLGCAILTGAGVVFNTAAVKPGSSVAVFGAGGIGLSAIMAASLAKAKRIIAVDILSSKLDLASLAGATELINAQKKDPLVAITRITDGQGVDYSIEASGQPGAMETAFRSVRDNGGLCVLAGNLPSGGKISIDPFDLIKGKRLVGTWGGETKPDRDIPRYVDLYLAGQLKLAQLITHEYSLDDINRAFDDLEAGKLGRALVDLR